MELPLDSTVRFGLSTSLPYPEAARATIELLERRRFDAIWVGDHVAFAQPIHEPLVQLALAAAYPSRLLLATGVYLLPLRHPTPVAKQVATLDRLTNGRLVFGVGAGGEFPGEFAACGVPVAERGARLSEGIAVLRALWSGQEVAHEGRFFPFPPTRIAPPPLRPGGPPIWCGGRSAAALARTGRQADGWLSYVVTPERYRESLESVARAAAEAKREWTGERATFGTGHVLFGYIDDRFEDAFAFANKALSARYAMDFTQATKRYAALGRPEDVAERLDAFYRAGVRHFVFDWLATDARRDEQIERFAEEVRPLLGWAR